MGVRLYRHRITCVASRSCSRGRDHDTRQNITKNVNTLIQRTLASPTKHTEAGKAKRLLVTFLLARSLFGLNAGAYKSSSPTHCHLLLRRDEQLGCFRHRVFPAFWQRHEFHTYIGCKKSLMTCDVALVVGAGMIQTPGDPPSLRRYQRLRPLAAAIEWVLDSISNPLHGRSMLVSLYQCDAAFASAGIISNIRRSSAVTSSLHRQHRLAARWSMRSSR